MSDVDNRYQWFFCVSPDAPTNPSLYWLGSFSEAKGTFDLDSAKGPYRLDLGDVLYAPNIMKDEVGLGLLRLVRGSGVEWHGDVGVGVVC